MKARFLITALAALMFTSCSTGFFVTSGYDDIYYTPGDEEVVVVEHKGKSSPDDRYVAIDNYQSNASGTREMVIDDDTLYYDDYSGSEPTQYIENNYYNDYWDSPYYTRIYRFHRPYYGISYYSPFYDYWYDPFYFDYWPGSYYSWNYGFYNPWYYRSWYSNPWYYRPYYMYDYYSPYYYGSYYSPYYYGGYYGNRNYSYGGLRHDPVEGRRRGMVTNRGTGGSRPVASATDIGSGRRTSATTITKSLNTGTDVRRTPAESGRPATYTRSTTTQDRVQTRTMTNTRSSSGTVQGSPSRYTRATTSSRSTAVQRPSTGTSSGTKSYTPRYTEPRNYTRPSYNRSSGSYSNSGSRSVYSRPSSSSSGRSSYSRPSSSGRSSYSSPSSGRSYSGSSGSRSSGSYSGGSSSRSSSSSSGSSRSSSSSGGHRR